MEAQERTETDRDYTAKQLSVGVRVPSLLSRPQQKGCCDIDARSCWICPCLCHWSVSTYVPGTRLHFPNAPNKLKKRYTPHFTAWETKAQSHKISTQGDQCMGRGLRFNSFNNSCDKAHKPEPINQSPHLTHEPARWLYNYTQSQALLVGVCYKAFFCPFNLLT